LLDKSRSVAGQWQLGKYLTTFRKDHSAFILSTKQPAKSRNLSP
jgi:hypothetical protein